MPWEKTFDVDEVLNSAMKQFWIHGYESTSMQDLVDKMGIKPGSLYATFGNKRKLFLSALRKYDDQYRASYLSELEATNKPVEAIVALFTGWIEEIAKDDTHKGCFLTNTALELATHDKEIGDIVSDSQKQTEKFLKRLIIAGQKNGEVSQDVNPASAAAGLLAALIGMLVLARSRPERRLLMSIRDNALTNIQ